MITPEASNVAERIQIGEGGVVENSQITPILDSFDRPSTLARGVRANLHITVNSRDIGEGTIGEQRKIVDGHRSNARDVSEAISVSRLVL